MVVRVEDKRTSGGRGYYDLYKQDSRGAAIEECNHRGYAQCELDAKLATETGFSIDKSRPNMSRGGRGGGRGGRGGSKSAFSLANMPDMGLSFADLQNMSVQETEMYPVSQPSILQSRTNFEYRLLLASGPSSSINVLHFGRNAHRAITDGFCRPPSPVCLLYKRGQES